MFKKDVALGLTCLAVAFIATGCSRTWTKLDPGAENVAVSTADKVTECRRLGKINTNTLERVAGVRRDRYAQDSELKILARNEALKLGANTVVAEGEMAEGSRSFGAYICP